MKSKYMNKYIITDWERGVLYRRKGCYEKECFFDWVIGEGLSKQVTFK